MTKPTWTDEEKFWRSIRQAFLALADAVETYKLAGHIETRTAEMRKLLKLYQRTYMVPPIAAEDVRERIAEPAAERAVKLVMQEEAAQTIDNEGGM